MGDRWTVIWPSFVLLLVLVAVAVIVVWKPPSTAPLREVSVRPIPPPTPELPETPWRETFSDVDLPTVTESQLVPQESAESSQTAIHESKSIEGATPDAALAQDEKGILAQKLLGLNYVSYTRLGSRKKGKIEDTIHNVSYDVEEGFAFPNGVLLESLEPKVATMRLGEATYELKLLRRPDFMNRPDLLSYMPSKEEQEQAKKWYMELYGEKLKLQSDKYKPPNGSRVPKQLSPEEEAEAKRQYFEQYGNKFQNEQNLADQAMKEADPEAQAKIRKKLYLEFWKKRYPDREPPFQIDAEE